MHFSRPLKDHHEICTQVWRGVKPKTYLRKILYPTARKFGGGTSDFADVVLTRRQSEAHNFETTQHDDKQKQDLSSKNGINLGASPHGVLMQPREKIDDTQKCVFCPIAENFLLFCLYFTHIIFWPQWPLPIALIVSGLCLHKIFGD